MIKQEERKEIQAEEVNPEQKDPEENDQSQGSTEPAIRPEIREEELKRRIDADMRKSEKEARQAYVNGHITEAKLREAYPQFYQDLTKELCECGEPISNTQLFCISCNNFTQFFNTLDATQKR